VEEPVGRGVSTSTVETHKFPLLRRKERILDLPGCRLSNEPGGGWCLSSQFTRRIQDR